MKKGFFLVLLLIGLLALSSLGFAANNHQVSVTINAYARIDVTGTASGTVLESDFDATGNASKALTSTVELMVKTNKANGCTVSASGTDFAADFPVSRLSLQVGTQSAVALGTTSATVATFATRQSGTPRIPVGFTVNLNGTESSGTYTSTVTYTVATNS